VTLSVAPGVSISDAALTQLVVRAVEQVEGARVRKPRRDVELADGRLELSLAAAYGVVLPDLALDVQARVADAVERMCGIRLAGVDVTIEELDR
jgi:uncharacterized alkaline shock family protein YloU